MTRTWLPTPFRRDESDQPQRPAILVFARGLMITLGWLSAPVSANQLGAPIVAGEPMRLSAATQWTAEPDWADAEGQVVAPATSALAASGEGSLTRGPVTSLALSPRTPVTLATPMPSDRLWLIDTRMMSSEICRLNLTEPAFRIRRLDECGCVRASSLDEYLSSMSPGRSRFIYIHGNRRSESRAISRGIDVYREVIRRKTVDAPIDWVIWSWPSDKERFIIPDARIKADRSDAQGLYLAWLLRHHVSAQQPTALIGFSFGGRVISGGLHALAGGRLQGRGLETPPIRGAAFDIGMLAPAIEDGWLRSGGRHGLATQNMDSMVLLYNHRDFILKNYWLINKVRGAMALGYTGPTGFAPRVDGTPLPVRAKDCAAAVGTQHRETEYYSRGCSAGAEMARLVADSFTHQ